MTAWFATVPAACVAVTLMTLPGLPVSWLLGFRKLGLLAVAVGASAAIVALASILAPVIGLRWSILPVLLLSALASVAAYSIHRWSRTLLRDAQRTNVGNGSSQLLVSRSWVLAVALLLAAVLVCAVMIPGIGDPTHPSQHWDAMYHLNAVTQVLETANASPFDMDLSAPGSAHVFYPTVWHACVALVVQITGASVVVATNVTSIVVSAWVWPIAILFFAAPFFIRLPRHLFLAAALSSGFAAFPFMGDYAACLYPNLVGTALLPIALGVCHLALRSKRLAVSDGSPVLGGAPPLPALWFTAVGIIGACALAHPNTLLGLSTLILPLLVAVAIDVARSDLPFLPRILRLAELTASVLIIVNLWMRLTTTSAYEYDSGLLGGIAQALSFDFPNFGHPTWMLTALTFGGICTLLIRRRHRWLITSFALVVVLFVCTVWLNNGFSAVLTSGWYNHAIRIAMLLPIAAVPLAGAFGSAVLDWATGRVQKLSRSTGRTLSSRWLVAFVTVIALGLVVVGVQSGGIAAERQVIADWHQLSESSEFVSPDEYALMQRLDRTTPEDAVIAGDPWTGTAYAYALSGRRVLLPHRVGEYSPATLQLATELRKLGREPACNLLNKLGVTHVLDFAGSNPNRSTRDFAGLRDVTDSPALTLIDQEGDARLYEVTC